MYPKTKHNKGDIMESGDIIQTEDRNKGDSQSVARHLPTIEVLRNHGGSGKDYIRVVVGKNAKHPNESEHHIKWIELYAHTKMLNVVKIGRVNFTPGTEPDAIFRLVYFGKYREFCAVSYCNVHGLWQSCIEIREELRLTAGCRREKCLQEGFGV
ncbi:superoxide reductase [Methanohalophilus levihalophilus]|uniref:desulfoferrodoxin family protein n=1 Tax=Methanohalophilus levihalophilus TaxID=1431282 RepID=UPI001AEB025D|nr:desulfoferrodoxin family protein [Methanohalophilus levihalophilus]MBP2030534.1 superoxide reductase [Methanohalophilus levihalophilus]